MAINQEIISTSWEGQQKSFIEAGLKTLLQRMLEVLESPLAANSVGSNQLTQELRDVINSIGSKVPNTRTVNSKELSSNITIGPDDIMVGNQTLSDVLEDIGQGGDTSGLASRIAALESALDDLTGVNDTTHIIDTFNEVIDFLNNVYNDETLISKLQQLQTQINSKANDNAVVKSISVNGTAQTKDQNGNVNIQVQTGSTISPATAAPQMDGTAAVGSSAKYAREDHVHPHDTSKANASDVYTKTQADTLLAGKQSKLTFDDAPTTGSNNPVKSGGIYDAIAAKLSQVTVNAIPAGSVAVENNLASSSETNALSANMGAELYALIQILFQQLNMIEVSEDGLYFIDSNDNIGVCIDSDGLHAINILEHVITE